MRSLLLPLAPALLAAGATLASAGDPLAEMGEACVTPDPAGLLASGKIFVDRFGYDTKPGIGGMKTYVSPDEARTVFLMGDGRTASCTMIVTLEDEAEAQRITDMLQSYADTMPGMTPVEGAKGKTWRWEEGGTTFAMGHQRAAGGDDLILTYEIGTGS
ncbi:hypothetical protein AADZ90_006845 [Aestuariibius sp. 2305UL40-4]|uniref:hypothetical protein n=1 Tax=Aestuariibius violaceus TaxID=3234132 RepID=UPI00345E86D5